MEILSPSPLARAAATLLAIAGTLLATSGATLAIGWFVILVPLTVLCGIFRQHVRFVLTILAPMAVTLLVVWGWIVAAPPGAIPGSSPEEGFSFAGLITFRVALLAGICQLCFLTIPLHNLAPTFRGWGLKGDGLVIMLGTFALIPELKLRTEQVLTARYARGLVAKRTFFSRVLQLPYLLRPLLAWVLRSAIQRSENWHQQDILPRLLGFQRKDETHTVLGSLVYLIIASSWVAYNSIIR